MCYMQPGDHSAYGASEAEAVVSGTDYFCYRHLLESSLEITGGKWAFYILSLS